LGGVLKVTKQNRKVLSSEPNKFLQPCPNNSARGAGCAKILPQQENNTRQMSRRADLIFPASCAQKQGTPRGDDPSKNLRLGRSLAVQTTQPNFIAVVEPPAPAA
jgi:hypothetical protein